MKQLVRKNHCCCVFKHTLLLAGLLMCMCLSFKEWSLIALNSSTQLLTNHIARARAESVKHVVYIPHEVHSHSAYFHQVTGIISAPSTQPRTKGYWSLCMNFDVQNKIPWRMTEGALLIQASLIWNPLSNKDKSLKQDPLGNLRY